MVMGSPELCKPVDRARGKAMKTELDRAMNRLD